MSSVTENLNQEDLLDVLIRYGLYFGAVFQLICIAACIFLPTNTKTTEIDEETDPQLDFNINGNGGTGDHHPQKKTYNKNHKKQEKKKRR